MEKISVAIIARGNEQTLEKCLNSVKNFDEIVLIVHPENKEKVESFAKKYNIKIFSQKWLGFAKQKNLAISKTKNDLVLSLDSDEEISPKLLAEIEKLDFQNHDGYLLPRLTYFLNHPVKHCGWYPDLQIRLFKKSMMNFKDTDVHEKIQPKGNIGTLKNDIFHFSYNSYDEYFERLDKYTTLQANLPEYQSMKISIFFYLQIIFKPIYRFINMYFGHLGFLDGWTGFTVCRLSAYYDFVVLKKVYKKAKNEK